MRPSLFRGFSYKGDDMRTFLAALAFASFPCFAQAACMAVEDDPAIIVSESQLASLAEISFTRKELFEALQATSEFETLSVGILQWNYGQNSLQGLMNSYRAAFPAPEASDAEIATLMPTYAATAFSDDCLAVPFSVVCKEKILAAHDEQGKLSSAIAAEYEALFNSTPMRQVQVTQFIDFLSAMKPKLTQMFGPTPTSLQTRWGIDLAIQQGYVKYTDSQTGLEQTAYLNPTDAASVRRLAGTLTPIRRRNRMISSLRWYSGLCGGIYQGVVSEQCNYNIKHWCAVVVHGVSDEQFDLFNLTYVRSRIATGQSGRWQANAFARRTKIVLGTGQVGQRKLDLPRGVRKTWRCNSMLIRD
jgi:hypothetical protein